MDKMWSLNIQKVTNGFILSWDEESELLNKSGELEMIEIKEVITDDDEKEEMKKLLERVADFFGMNYEKYKEDNLNITWDKKGHKL